MKEPRWLKKAQAEGRISYGPSFNLPEKQVEATQKRGKYGNVIVEQYGIKFHSKKELKRWNELKLLLASGLIRNLKRQVQFDIIINDMRVTTYVADHVYEEIAQDRSGWATVVEDVKSSATQQNAVYRLKRKLMLAVFGITIREV